MAGTDGVTPLNAANVLHKAAADTRQGNETFVNGAPVLTGATMKIPYRFRQFYALPREADDFEATLTLPMVCLAAPTVISVTPRTIIGLRPDSPTILPFTGGSAAENDYNARRAVILKFAPYYAANSLASNISDVSVSAPLSDASNFPNPATLGQTFYIRIEDEIIEYTGITGNTLTGLTRGVYGTTAAAHTSGKQVRLLIQEWIGEGFVNLGGF